MENTIYITISNLFISPKPKYYSILYSFVKYLSMVEIQYDLSKTFNAVSYFILSINAKYEMQTSYLKTSHNVSGIDIKQSSKSDIAKLQRERKR